MLGLRASGFSGSLGVLVTQLLNIGGESLLGVEDILL